MSDSNRELVITYHASRTNISIRGTKTKNNIELRTHFWGLLRHCDAKGLECLQSLTVVELLSVLLVALRIARRGEWMSPGEKTEREEI